MSYKGGNILYNTSSVTSVRIFLCRSRRQVIAFLLSRDARLV